MQILCKLLKIDRSYHQSELIYKQIKSGLVVQFSFGGENMAEAVVSFVAEKLGDFIIKEASFCAELAIKLSLHKPS